ncbi:MAG: hypothetical protein SFU56_20155 [Capsulimonadales bacterium]|nr:hypothetical protein [Capsulimonadales bacterium]
MNDQEFDIVRAAVWIVGVPIIVVLLVSIVRRTRAITRRIAELREEEKRGMKDPYARMAALYEQQEARETLERAGRGRV